MENNGRENNGFFIGLNSFVNNLSDSMILDNLTMKNEECKSLVIESTIKIKNEINNASGSIDEFNRLDFDDFDNRLRKVAEIVKRYKESMLKDVDNLSNEMAKKEIKLCIESNMDSIVDNIRKIGVVTRNFKLIMTKYNNG